MNMVEERTKKRPQINFLKKKIEKDELIMRECIVTYSNLHVNHPKEMTGIPYRTKKKSKDNTRLSIEV